MNLEELKIPFEESEIEWRIDQVGKKQDGKPWAKCVPYISARSIQDRLDKVCGAHNWKVEYHALNTTQPGIICSLSIKVGDEWVTKQDGADQTDTEAFKGGLSSALKRVGSIWGIGRYMYGLQIDFANIVEKSSEAIYSRSKLKDGSYIEFYWMPPRLPAWALPIKLKELVKDNSIKAPNNPPPKDPWKEEKKNVTSINSAAGPIPEDLSQAVFQQGIHTGKTMGDLLKEDSAYDYKYGRWVAEQMEINLVKVTPSQEKYFRYCQQEGVFDVPNETA